MTTLTQLLASMPTPERPNAFVDMIELYLVYEDLDDLGNTRLAYTATDASSAARLAEGLGHDHKATSRGVLTHERVMALFAMPRVVMRGYST